MRKGAARGYAERGGLPALCRKKAMRKGAGVAVGSVLLVAVLQFLCAAPPAARGEEAGSTSSRFECSARRCWRWAPVNLNLRGGREDSSGPAAKGAQRAKTAYSASDFEAASTAAGGPGIRGVKESREDEEARRKARNKNKKILRKRQGKFVPSIKNRIRNVERTLHRKGHLLPEDAKIEMASKLAKLQDEQQEATVVERERAMATKYRKPKFFERKKLQRRLLQCTRELENAETEGEREKLQLDRRKLLEDIQYVLYYPRDMKYVSILKNPRSVIDELKSSPEFQAKMDKARQVVLAYRAMKLKQQQQQQQQKADVGGAACPRGTKGGDVDEAGAMARDTTASAKKRSKSSRAPDEVKGRDMHEEQSEEEREERSELGRRRLRTAAERPQKRMKLGRKQVEVGDDESSAGTERSEEGHSVDGIDPSFTDAMRREQRRNALEIMKGGMTEEAEVGDEEEDAHHVSDSECDRSGHSQGSHRQRSKPAKIKTGRSVPQEESDDDSEASDSVQIFDTKADQSLENPLARFLGKQGAEDDEDVDPDSESESERRKKSASIFYKLRGFTGEDELSETEIRRRKVSHARENFLGPGDASSSDPDRHDDAADPEGGRMGEGGDGDGSGGSHGPSQSQPSKGGTAKAEVARKGGGGQGSYRTAEKGGRRQNRQETCYEAVEKPRYPADKAGVDIGDGDSYSAAGDGSSEVQDSISASILAQQSRSNSKKEGESRGGQDTARSRGEGVRSHLTEDKLRRDDEDGLMEVSGDLDLRHLTPSALKTPKPASRTVPGEVDACLGHARTARSLPMKGHTVRNSRVEMDDTLMDFSPGVLHSRTPTVHLSARYGEQETSGGVSREEREGAASAPPERTGVWAGGASEQWWSPADIDAGMQATQVIEGLEKERQVRIKEAREIQARREQLAANMTEAERASLAEQARKELLEIETASLRSLRNSTGAAVAAQWSALGALSEPAGAEIDETAQRMRREQPGKVCYAVVVMVGVLLYPASSPHSDSSCRLLPCPA